ncbi:MAG: hypothetical protein JRI42_09460 [Deltaproteobacteria bacterium]|nr:hypothetical protein [Deltaproteobacteria bacterium]
MSDKWMNTKEYFVTYSIMIKAAQHQGLATYQEIAGELVGLVSKNELEQGRPMMSAIVVSVSGRPGDGFFDWARELGQLSENEDKESFWIAECKRIYKEWAIPYRTNKK